MEVQASKNIDSCSLQKKYPDGFFGHGCNSDDIVGSERYGTCGEALQLGLGLVLARGHENQS